VIYRPTPEDIRAYQKMRVVICTPCKDYENPIRFTRSLANMIAYSWKHGLKVEQFGMTERMVVHWAREQLAKQVRDFDDESGKFTHILWLDDDHVFNPDLLCYLARNADKDVVSALYYGRTAPLPVAYVKDKDPDPYKHYPLIWPPSLLCEVDAVGFGALLMRRDVLDRIKEPYFRFNNSGEDIYFCVHAKQQGIKIWLDGSYQIGHIGDPQIVGREQYERYVKENEAAFGPKIKVALGGM
jgi:hypothetical protein